MISIAIESAAVSQFESTAIHGNALAGIGRNLEQGPTCQLPHRNYITVKEAADRLNKTVWAIYRMKRDNGPFPIAKERGRVRIELAGFESFVARERIATSFVDTALPTSAHIERAQRSSVAENQHAEQVDGPDTDATTAVSDANAHRVEPILSASGFGSGQRELPLNWVYRTNLF